MSQSLLPIYFTLAILFLVFSFLPNGRKVASFFKACLFLLGLMGIKPGILGEQYGAIGIVCLAPFAFSYLVSKSKQAENKWIGWELVLIPVFFVWGTISSNFSEGPIFVQATAVAVLAFVAAYNFSRNERDVIYFVRIFFVVILWQCLSALATILIPSIFTIQVLDLDFGRNWIYFSNNLGAIFVGNNGDLSGSLSALGISVLDRYPRLTAFWGEPSIFAILCAFVSAIHANIHKKWKIGFQVPIIIAILLCQSFGGICIYLVVAASTSLFKSSNSASKFYVVRNRTLVIAFTSILFLFASPQLGSRLDSTNSSFTERAGNQGLPALIIKIFSNPLGTGGSGSINLLQSSANSGILTLVLGLAIFVFIPGIAMKGSSFSPVILVPAIAILFVQPPSLPLWYALLGLFFANVAKQDHSEVHLGGPQIPTSGVYSRE